MEQTSGSSDELVQIRHDVFFASAVCDNGLYGINLTFDGGGNRLESQELADLYNVDGLDGLLLNETVELPRFCTILEALYFLLKHTKDTAIDCLYERGKLPVRDRKIVPRQSPLLLREILLNPNDIE